MTKQEEKDRLAAFIASLPQESYLRPMLSEIQLEIEKQIDNDIGFISFSARIDEQSEHRKYIGELIATRDALNLEIRKSTRLHDQLTGALADLRSTARKMAVA